MNIVGKSENGPEHFKKSGPIS